MRASSVVVIAVDLSELCRSLTDSFPAYPDFVAAFELLSVQNYLRIRSQPQA